MSKFHRFGWLNASGNRLLRANYSWSRGFFRLAGKRFLSVVSRGVSLQLTPSFAWIAGSRHRLLRTSGFLFDNKHPEGDSGGVRNRSLLRIDGFDQVSTNLLEGEIAPPGSDELSPFESESLTVEAFTDVYEKSSPKCPGCGAVFQSDNPDKAGYILPTKNPSVHMHQGGSKDVGTKPLVCQKCFNLKHYNKPFPAVVSQDQILDYLGQLQRRKGLIIYVVDILDLPGSLFPRLLEIVGEAKRIIIVGNKVDMLPVDGHARKQEEHLKMVLTSLCKTRGLYGANLKSVCLISAKSGFGILQLASKILEHWDHKGDIYLVGCSNAGKTTLFNLLLDLFSVHKKADLLQRATVSLWPYTTQRMLRFPIGHWMLKRLCKCLREGVQSSDSDDEEIDIDGEIIDKSSTDYKEEIHQTKKGKLVPLNASGTGGIIAQLATLNPSFVMDKPNKNRTWLYDTPGIMSEKQITNMLTMEELKCLNPTLWLVPRTFILKPGQSMLLGGLGRVDYLEIKRRRQNSEDEWDTIPEGVQSVYFTVFASPNVPAHLCKVSSADGVYAKHAGEDLLRVPCGGKERMKTFPELKPSEFTVKGVGWEQSAADIVLSNLGWVAVTAGVGSLVSIKAYTPNGVGLDIREPALCPTSVSKRGKRGAMYQGHVSPAQYQSTRRQNPQFIQLARGEHWGEKRWMKEIKQKRKEQLFLVKAEKWIQASEKTSLGYSAVSSPPRIPGAVGIPPPRDRLKSGQKS